MFDPIDQTKLPVCFVYKAPRAQIVTAENVAEYSTACARSCGHPDGFDAGCLGCRDTAALIDCIEISGAVQVYPKQ